MSQSKGMTQTTMLVILAIIGILILAIILFLYGSKIFSFGERIAEKLPGFIIRIEK